MKFIIFIIGLFILSSCDNPLSEDRNEDRVYVFDQCWAQVDRHYSYFTEQALNWDSVYTYYRPQVNDQTTEQELFEVLDEMLTTLNDPHTNIYSNRGIGGSVDYFAKFPVNQLDDISQYFEYYEMVNRTLDYGLIKNTQLGYIKIKTFGGNTSDYEDVTRILSQLTEINGLIIDVRSNRGGMISNAKTIMEQLVKKNTKIAQYRFRNGYLPTEFSDWIDFELSPTSNNSQFEQPLVILTNRQCFSACEWFVMGMRTLPQTTQVGDTTGGGSAIPILRELPNGWLVRISNTQLQPSIGQDFQRTGIYPNVPIWINNIDVATGKDVILEKGIEVLHHN